jgi:hypothetical protein
MPRRILLLFPALLLAASSAFAQSTTVVPDWYNAIPYCNTAGGTNCEHTMPSVPTGLVSVAVGGGVPLGQDSSYNVWQYTDFTGWAEKTQYGNQITGLNISIVLGPSAMVALGRTGTSLNSGCSAGGHVPYLWSGTAWAQMTYPGCVSQVLVGENTAVLLAIDYNSGNLMHWNGSGWETLSGGPYTTCATWGFQIKGTYCITTAGKLYYLSNTGTLTMTQDTTAPANLTTVATYAPKEAGGVWVGSSTVPGLWHYDGTAWQKMVIAAGPTNLTSGGPMLTFYTSTTRFGSSLVRFPDSLIGFMNTVNNPGGCSTCQINQGIVHTAHIATGSLYRQIGGGTTYDSARPYYTDYNYQQLVLTADPFYVMEGNNLSYAVTFGIDCSFLGGNWYVFATEVLLQATDFSKYFNHTHLQVQNPEQCVNDNPWKGCTFNTVSWCTADSTPPNYNPSTVKYLLTDPKDPSYLDASAVCFSNVFTGHQWKCATFGDQPTASTNSAKVECTHTSPN